MIETSVRLSPPRRLQIARAYLEERRYVDASVRVGARRVREAGTLERLPEESRAVAALVASCYLGPEAAEGILATAARQQLEAHRAT